MLEKLGQVIKKATDKIANAIFLDKNLVDQIIKDLQRALIEADVNVSLVKDLSDKIRKSALDERIKGIEKKEHIIKLLHDELVKILGEYKQLKLKTGQNRIILLGLYGAGKTTTIAKLGNWFAKRGKKVALVGLDVHRPAAKEQLKQLGEKNNLNVFVDFEENDAVKTWKKFEKDKKFRDSDLILIDTAGRHNLDKELVQEIKALGKEIKPTETILIMPADIGQAAKQQAEDFQKALNISGVIITRMDSTAKAGGALTACNETKAPVYFIGTGEKTNDFETFNPKSFISRLLGLGDLEGLLEKVQSAIDEKSQKRAKERLEKGEFNLRDFQEQLKQMGNVGSFDKMLEMIPGSGKAKIPENLLGAQENKLKKWQFAIDSMTEKEIDNPEILEKQTSRLGRIAKGSGTTTTDIRQMLKQYKLLKEIASGTSDLSSIDPSQGLNQKQIMKIARKFKGKIKF